MPTYKTRGIVIKRMNLGEADRILTIFTDNFGKIKAVGKSVRKPTSRKSGHLEPLNLTDLFLAEGRSLDIITQAKVEQSFQNIKQDLKKTSQACYLAELVDRFTDERHKDWTLFSLFLQTLSLLDQLAEKDKISLLLRTFELKFLSHLGFAPKLDHCVSCGVKIEPGSYQFDLLAGGLHCPGCQQPGNSKLTVEVIKLLRFLQKEPLERCLKVKAPDDVLNTAESTLRDFVRFTLERELKTTDFLDQVKTLN